MIGRRDPREVLYFLHIHKTAGTTLRQVIETRFARDEICPAQLWSELRAMPPSELGRYRLFRGHFLHFAHLLPREPVVVTMLRDPVERSISTYHFIRRNPAHHLFQVARRLTFDEYLRDRATIDTVRDFQTRWIVGNMFPCENVHQLARRLRHEGRDLLGLARQYLEQIAFVGLVERFEASVWLMCAALGWAHDDRASAPLATRMNATPSRPTREVLAASTVDRILELTPLDQRLYAHAEQLFEQRLRERASTPGAGPEGGGSWGRSTDEGSASH